MNKFAWAALLVGMALLGYMLYSNSNKPSNEESVEQDVTTLSASGDNFPRNQECLKNKSQLETKLERKDSPFGKASLEQVFYSPKTQSCLYVEYTIDETTHYNRRLFDISNDGPNSKPILACHALYGSPELLEAYRSIDNGLKTYTEGQAGCDNFDQELMVFK